LVEQMHGAGLMKVRRRYVLTLAILPQSEP
jgi:hypothetical protein